MPTAVAKGIILSLSIIAALGLAVVENPHVQQWLEEQRQKIAELLRQLGEELDPQSRREAEAFAYEGRTPANDEALQREASGSMEAAQVATGRSLSSASTIRRIPIQGPMDPNEAEERRRKGREYLARRNQQMYELQQRRKAEAKEEGTETPPTPTFDELVDAEGHLKALNAVEPALPSLPVTDQLPLSVQAEMKEVERQLSQPILLNESSTVSSSTWQTESAFTNPFSDEHALERSITPKPPVPPKIELSRPSTPPVSIPGSFERSEQPLAQGPLQNHEELSYEEQIAIALSLSEQESAAASATTRQHHPEEDDADLKAAIAASLKEMHRRDMDHEQAAHAIANNESGFHQRLPANFTPQVNLSPAEPTAIRPPREAWATFFDSQLSPSNDPLTSSRASEASDELYRLTPELTRARLATFNAQQALPETLQPPSPERPTVTIEHQHEAAREPLVNMEGMDASFHSALDVASRSRSVTLDHEEPQLIDIDDEEVLPEGARTPTSRALSSFGFETDTDTDTFASVSASGSRAPSRARSENSLVEVVEVVEDSDIDMMSDDDDGMATPDSWSEVGSRDADSEVEEEHTQHS